MEIKEFKKENYTLYEYSNGDQKSVGVQWFDEDTDSELYCGFSDWGISREEITKVMLDVVTLRMNWQHQNITKKTLKEIYDLFIYS